MLPFRSSPEEWANFHFFGLRLGDRRLDRRGMRLAALLARTPSGTLPGAMPTYADLKAAYRLLGHRSATHEALLSPHKRVVQEACGHPGEYLLIEDTSSFDFSFHDVEDLGPIGDGGGRGFHLHTTLAARYSAEGVELLGVFAQQPWVRKPDPQRARESTAQRSKRARESERWANAIPEAPKTARWVYVADRESDIYRCMRSLRDRNIDLVIRAAYNRKLKDSHLQDAARSAPVVGSYELKLRGRPQSPARIARIEMRACRVSIQPPLTERGSEALELNLVEAREIDPPPTGGVRWLLLTSLPADSHEQARAVVARYSKRWLIEEYHKCLKTGCGMEESQLCSYHSLAALLAVMAVVSVRLLGMKLLAESRPDEEVAPDILGERGLKLLGALRPQKRPKGVWTWRTMLIALGCLGGFIGRKSDGMPGWQNLWRGQIRLQQAIEGVEALRKVDQSYG